MPKMRMLSMVLFTQHGKSDYYYLFFLLCPNDKQPNHIFALVAIITKQLVLNSVSVAGGQG